MKLYAIIEVNDDMYDDFKEWYIRGDDLEIRYVEDDAYTYYKPIANDMLKLKPLPPKRIDVLDDDTWQAGWNDCIKEIIGEE